MKNQIQPTKEGAMRRRFAIALALIAVLVVGSSMIGGTLAYLSTQTPEIENVFTLGELNYQLTYVANPPDGFVDNDVLDMPVPNPAKFTIAASEHTFESTAPVLTGHKFLGWADSEDATTPDYPYNEETGKCLVTVEYDPETFKVDGALTEKTVFAVWKQMDFTVTFDTQVEGLTVDPATKTVTYLEKYDELPTPVRTGYIFEGWTLEQTIEPGTTPEYITADSIVNIAADHNLYAQWRPITYQVRYIAVNDDADPITGSMANSTHTYDVESNLTAIGYQKANYKFAGWSTTPNGAVNYVDKHAIINLANEDNAVVDLYAQWIPSTQYLITYHANAQDASFKGGAKAYTEAKLHNTPYLVKAPGADGVGVTRNDYWIWTEWNTKADGSGTRYLDGASYTANADLDLYAIWKPRTDVVFDLINTAFVNMGSPSKEISDDGYKITVKCKTQSGADGISIPIKNLIPGQAYKLTFTVDFEISDFYTEDNHAYMFGMNIMDKYLNYHKDLSIIEQDDAKVTTIYENMRWSTEATGRYEVDVEFVASEETMYWFWETTDITDNEEMTYNFNSFSISRVTKPQPRVEFENLYVTYELAPSTELSKWTPDDERVRHKNYFRTEKYDFDSLTYRHWGTSGHERMTIPISGLEVGQWYELSFSQDLSRAQVYNTNKNNLNDDQLYGAAITEEKTLGEKELGGNGVHDQTETYQDLRKAKVGANYNGSFTFQATAETMYWQWTFGDLKDGWNGSYGSKVYSWVTLDNVKIKETEEPPEPLLSLAYDLPGVTLTGADDLTVGEPAVLTLTGDDIPDVLNVEVTGTQSAESTVSTFALWDEEAEEETADEEAEQITTTMLYKTGLNEALVNASAVVESAAAYPEWLTQNEDGTQTLIIPADLMTEGVTITITGDSYDDINLTDMTYEQLN